MHRRSPRVVLQRILVVAASCLAAGAGGAGPSRAASSPEDDGKKATIYKEAQFLARLGYRELRGDTWDAARGQDAIGFEGDWRPRDWPVWPEFALNVSGDTTNDQLAGEEDGVLFEVSAGVKRYFGKSLRPYVGGGFAWVYGRQDLLVDVGRGIRATESDRSSSFGWYLHAGLSIRFGSKFHWGLDARVMRGTETTFFGRASSLDYDEATLFVGFAW
jgi:opacity protein-like surface antigen